jgi:hypothetical protein
VAAKNEGKRILCTVIVHEIASSNEHEPRAVRVDLDLSRTTVAHVLELAKTSVMAQLKGKK